MDAVGVFNDLVNVVGEGVLLLVEGVHLERAATLAGHLIIIPPRELRNEDLLIVALHQEVVNGVLQDFLAAVGQQHLLFGHSIDFTYADADDALLSLIVDSGIKN